MVHDKKTGNTSDEKIVGCDLHGEEIFITWDPLNIVFCFEDDNEKNENNFNQDFLRKISREDLHSIKSQYMLSDNIINLF